VIDMVFKTAQEQAEKVLRSPATLRFLSNPRVQKTMLQAINLRAEIRQKVTTQVKVSRAITILSPVKMSPNYDVPSGKWKAHSPSYV